MSSRHGHGEGGGCWDRAEADARFIGQNSNSRPSSDSRRQQQAALARHRKMQPSISTPAISPKSDTEAKPGLTRAVAEDDRKASDMEAVDQRLDELMDELLQADSPALVV